MSKGQRSHDISEMEKNVSNLVLCFSLVLLTLKQKSMAYIPTANRTIERSLNVSAISPTAYRSGQRLHIVGTIEKKLK